MVLSVADNVVVMALGWCGVQATLNAMLAAVTATVPDQVPVGRRGRVGGILAIAQTARRRRRHRHRVGDRQHRRGLPRHRRRPRRADLPYCLDSRDHAAAAASCASRSTYAGSCGRSGSHRALHPDFAWAWLTRFLVNLGNAVGLLYLLYFMQDVVGYSSDEAADRVFVLTAIYAATLVLTTVVFGIWSDRTGRRKVFVIWSGVVRGRRALLLGAGQSWPRGGRAARP